MLTANNIKAKIGINTKKSLCCHFYGLNSIRVNIFATFNHSFGIYINNIKSNVIIDIVSDKALDIDHLKLYPFILLSRLLELVLLLLSV